jgi:hypothetical protein
MNKPKKSLTEEHKRKIGQANKNKIRTPEFKRQVSETLKSKGIKPKKIYNREGQEHWRFNQGSGSDTLTIRRMLKKTGFNIDHCSQCDSRKNIHVHHTDENRKNNEQILNNSITKAMECGFG